MSHNGAVIYIRFDAKEKRLYNMMNSNHETYTKIPKELMVLKKKLLMNYAFFVPLDFRYFYAYERFELMGVLTRYEDTIQLVLEVEEQLANLGFPNQITIGFGQVHLPQREEDLAEGEILHKISGTGVLAAFAYFKEKENQTMNLPYYFESAMDDCHFLNVPKEQLKKNRKHFSQQLRNFQEKKD